MSDVKADKLKFNIWNKENGDLTLDLPIEDKEENIQLSTFCEFKFISKCTCQHVISEFEIDRNEAKRLVGMLNVFIDGKFPEEIIRMEKERKDKLCQT